MTGAADPQPREGPAFADADALLREDVRMLGALVGGILSEQRGPIFLETVEEIRRLAIARREQGAPMDTLAAPLAGASVDEATDLVRAFGAYFAAVNLAERVHRIRRRRDYQRTGAAPQPGGLESVLRELHDAGVGFDALAALLPRLRIEPVFTAHPTEAVRRALLEKEREVVRRLVADIDRQRTPVERAADLERIRFALTAAWQTSDAPPARPTVADEREHVGYYLGDVLYRVLPVFHEAFADAIAATYGEAVELPPVLRFGTWVGGDMDGNPSIGADTVLAALEAQRAQVLGLYRGDLRRLAGALSQSRDRVGIDPVIDAATTRLRSLFGDVAANPRHADMPYRQLLDLVVQRVRATAEGAAQAYRDPEALLADLALVDASLARHRGDHAGRFALRRIVRRIQCFGFHLATLDLRQDSAVHDAALAVLEDDPAWASHPVEVRVARLQARIASPADMPPAPATSEDAGVLDDTLAAFRAVGDARERFGREAIGLYIVSMSRSAADALAVLALARAAGCVLRRGQDERFAECVPLDVAPLFETVGDLEAAPAVMRALFDDPVYRRHLASRGNRQTVMLGYSDSAKDGGLLASRWALQRAQVELTALAQSAGVQLAYFHGRGGSISRGGGKTERAVIAAPRGSVDGRLRVTEQGEVIHRKYGIRALAARNLEQTAGAVLRASLRPRPAEPREGAWRALATELATVSSAHYRALVQDDGFDDYFRAATPIDVIERLHLGSRPPRRQAGDATDPGAGITRLRAIPWVFAWAQNRSGLTAWYGVGTALAHGIARHGLDAMAAMGRDWPFLRVMLDDVAMAMAKSDLDIFARYSRLSGALHAAWFARVHSEFARTHDAVLAILGQDTLLQDDPRLRQSIRLRNPYVDPISLLQVELLQRWRAGDRKDDDVLRALLATVNGIAAGIQNTG